MKNIVAITSIARTLGKIAEKLEATAYASRDTEETDEGLSKVYDEMLMDEVHHVQVLTLELTKAVIPEENADEGESAFIEGELNSVVGPPDDEEGKEKDA